MTVRRPDILENRPPDSIVRDVSGPSAMTLPDVFVQATAQHATRVALVAGNDAPTYEQLLGRAARVATLIDAHADASHRLCGLLGAATAAAFEGILGILLTGRGYVPLNPAFPSLRTSYMVEASGVSVIIVDRNGRSKLADVLSATPRPLTVILPDAGNEEIEALRRGHPTHRFVDCGEGSGGSSYTPRRAAPNDIAYLMFTSGSTGKPKGVMVSHANIVSYLRAMRDRYDFVPEDRFSQMFDLTFDLSLYDMFVCWGSGASLHIVPTKDRMAPGAFIRRQELTAWFSVPAVAGFMHQLKMLKPGAFPTLRVSAFCGEPLPAALAEAWQQAAPSSHVDNLYGPTELTVACTAYRWTAGSRDASENGIVPIGRPYPELEAALVDDRLTPVKVGEAGELCVRGPQTCLGYWQNEKLTSERFVAMPWMTESDNRWYRTGDLVRMNTAGDFIFVGRVDNQVKILGYRVELGEIEAKLREHGDTQFAIAIPWPLNDSGASGVVACLAGSEVADGTILEACQRDLPDYMVPKRIFRFDQLPLNANGKIDRNQLKEAVARLTGAAGA
jgi:amino acid adenylation domain-containing protein